MASKRRLSDDIIITIHQACDQGELKVAGQLLDVLEFIIKRQQPVMERRTYNEGVLVAAHERLWHILHPEVTLPGWQPAMERLLGESRMR